MEAGDWVALATLLLLPVGFGLTWYLYKRERENERLRDRDAALSVLRAVRDGIRPWGDEYFSRGYNDASAQQRAQADYDWIMKDKSYGEIFHVPADPLRVLLSHSAAGGLIGRETVEAASVALWQIGIFNQLVRQKSDFNGRHLVEIRDSDLPPQRRRALADAAFSQSAMLHAKGVDDVAWYANLMGLIETNIETLMELR